MPLLVGFLVLVSLVQAPAGSGPAGSGQAVWPPAGVFTMRDGIIPPEIVTRINPTYTREGMRQRIQGFVTLQFVVELDGTVGPVRVVRSLDAASGLDDAAVGAVKQWRFKAGTKDGRPVRVMATAVLTFGLRDVPPPLTLPEGFSSASDIPGQWSTSQVTSNNVHVQFQNPEGWELEDRPAMAAAIGRFRTLQSFGIYRPAPLPRPLPPFPMPVVDLMSLSEFVRRSFASQGKHIEVLAVGQSPLGATNWLWFELDLADEARAWAFVTTVGTQSVQVICSVGTPRIKMTEGNRDAAIARARTDCASILKRVAFSAR